MSTVIIQKRKRKKGTTYPVYYKEPLTGKKKYYKTFQKLREAQQVANDLRSLLDVGRPPEKIKRKLKLMAFEQVASLLKSEWDQKLLQDSLSEKTHSDYCYWLNRLNHVFGKKLLCNISKREVEDYINNQAVKHSKVTGNKYLSAIKKVFCLGLAINAIAKNPVAEIQSLSEKSHERNRFLLPHQLDRLIEAAKKSRAKHYLSAIIYLGAEHGASKQEILSLKWSDIDFDFAGKGLIKFFRTKNRKERVEFLMPRTKKSLLSWRDHLKWKRKRDKIFDIKSNYVFTRINGNPIKSFNKSWWGSLKEAGIEDFHFHDLRHTFCSNLILSGADLKDVKEMIGHKDISMTDRYSHLTTAYKLQKQELLADYYMHGIQSKTNCTVGVT